MKFITSCFKNPEVRNKILFTLLILFIYRIGAAIPVPGVNAKLLSGLVGDDLFNNLNLLGGGALERMSIFAMGVSPYITGSIVIQLLSMDVIPALTEMAKGGQPGRLKLERITRYTGFVLAFLQSLAMVYGFDNQYGILIEEGIASYLYVSLILTAGCMLLVWLGDRIMAHGIGNGLSMIIFAGIVANLPSNFINTYSALLADGNVVWQGVLMFIGYCLFYLLISVGIVFIETAVRRIPIQYTNGTITKAGSNMSYIPLKINSASVIPVIFAQSLITAPQIVISFFSPETYNAISPWLSLTSWTGLALYAVLTILFTFFYTDIQIDPEKLSQNLNNSGAFIPGVKPGKETEKYIRKVLYRITTVGALGLTLVAVLPYIVSMINPSFSAIGGTGIIIIVGVAMETIKQLKSSLIEARYATGSRGFF